MATVRIILNATVKNDGRQAARYNVRLVRSVALPDQPEYTHTLLATITVPATNLALLAPDATSAAVTFSGDYTYAPGTGIYATAYLDLIAPVAGSAVDSIISAELVVPKPETSGDILGTLTVSVVAPVAGVARGVLSLRNRPTNPKAEFARLTQGPHHLRATSLTRNRYG